MASAVPQESHTGGASAPEVCFHSMSQSFLRNVLLKPRIFAKYLASFFKREWTIEDYPISVRFQQPEQPPINSRFKPIPWYARIDNWIGLSGGGESKSEALAALQNSFLTFKSSGKELPRPGAYRPIDFASSELVSKYPELRDDFIHRVLGLEWAFISDKSSLWNFHEEGDNSAFFLKIGEVYGVDVVHVENGNIAKILSVIMDDIREFPEDPINRSIRLGHDARNRYVMGLPELPWNPY